MIPDNNRPLWQLALYCILLTVLWTGVLYILKPFVICHSC